MALAPITHVGHVRLGDFDLHCRKIVLLMTDGVRRTVENARKNPQTFQITTKEGYDGVAASDVRTRADEYSQLLLWQYGQANFPPELGWNCEELNLRQPSRFPRHQIVITGDPLDGTKTLIEIILRWLELTPGRVSVMLSLVVDGVPIAGYVCDVADLVLYIRPPYSDTVLRIDSITGTVTDMATLPRARSLSEGTLLVHNDRPPVSPLGQWLVESNVFRSVATNSDSIGLAAARVLTGEFAGLLRTGGGYSTPWDDGAVEALVNYRFGDQRGEHTALRIGDDGFYEIGPPSLDEVTPRDFDKLYAPRQRLHELARLAPVTLL